MASIMRKWSERLGGWLRDQRGLALPETIAAVAIMGTAVVAFITALSAGSIAVREGDQEAVAQRLARTQLEYIKSRPYATAYAKVDEPEGYTISIGVGPTSDNDADIQKITVTVSREGDEILTVENYKVNR